RDGSFERPHGSCDRRRLRVPGALRRGEDAMRGAAPRSRGARARPPLGVLESVSPMSTGMGIPKDALLAARNVVQEYGLPDGRRVRAVSDVSFDLGWGENLAIVGETASGKTTLARTL